MLAGSEDDKEKVEEFRELFGRFDDTSSIAFLIRRICHKGLYNDEIKDAEDIIQEVALESFIKHNKGGINNLKDYCCRIARTKVSEYRRKKSASIEYRKLARDLESFYSVTSSLKGGDRATSIARRLFVQLTERDQGSIDGKLILDQLLKLIEIEKTFPQHVESESLKIIEFWKEKLKEKIKENEAKTVSLDWEEDENHGGFPFFDYKYVSAYTESPEEALSREQIADQLMECLSKLPADLEKLVMLRVGEGLKFKQIHKSTETPIATIADRVNKALAALRDCLAKNGIKRG